jgi:hypothetical protein
MRDILDKIATLLESTGLAGRKPGAVFKNPSGDTITFKDLQFYPTEGGKMDKATMDQALKQFTNVNWKNMRTTRSGGFGIATFDTPQGEKQYGFYKDSINPNFTDNYIPNEVDGYRLSSAAAEKTQSGLTPQDLLSQRDNLTSEDIVQQLTNKLGADSPLVQIATRVASGEEFPLTFPVPEGISMSGFRDYFCEILQPMALQTGQYKGNAGEAAETFLGGSFAGTTISFDAAKNAGLSDSIMTNSDSKSVKISTKGGTGAQASAKNLIDSANELSQTPNGKKLLDTYSDTIEMIRTLQSKGQVDAPLWLGVKYDIISDDEANKIKSLKGQKPVNMDDIDRLNLGDNLTTLAKERKTDTPEKTNLFYHLIAAVAFKAAAKVNSDSDFSKAATDILNNGALIQVYTNLKTGKDSWTLDPFKTVFPGKSIKGVDLSASKNYFSTGIKGNFTFKIDRGGKKSDAETADTGTSEPNAPVAPLPDIAKSITEPRLKRPKATEPNVEPTDYGPAGRAKR